MFLANYGTQIQTNVFHKYWMLCLKVSISFERGRISSIQKTRINVCMQIKQTFGG